MTPKEFVEWVKTLPEWQQDALRRIAEHGTLQAKDLDDLRAALKVDGGFKSDHVTKLQPITEEHIGVESDSDAPTSLRCISNVQNANLLAPGQNLRFAPKNLTVIYGENGSGKTGYCRLAKAVCLAHRKDRI